MSAILDIILILIVAIFIIIGVKKGFVRSVSGFLIYIFSFNIANAFYIFVAKYTDKIAFIAELNLIFSSRFLRRIASAEWRLV